MITTFFLILMLMYGVIYSFLPTDIQRIGWVKFFAILSAIIILVWGIKQAIQEYRSYRFAYIAAKDGAILKKKNFPWTVTKSYYEGNVVYSINERYGDATDIVLKIPSKNIKYEVYNAMNGVGIKFTCSESEIPDFKIEISQ